MNNRELLAHPKRHAKWLKHLQFLCLLLRIVYPVDYSKHKVRYISIFPGVLILYIHHYTRNIDFRMTIFLWVLRFFYYGVVLMNLSCNLVKEGLYNFISQDRLIDDLINIVLMIIIEVADHRARWQNFKKQADEEQAKVKDEESNYEYFHEKKDFPFQSDPTLPT